MDKKFFSQKLNLRFVSKSILPNYLTNFEIALNSAAVE
jgi:hypothetical protein